MGKYPHFTASKNEINFGKVLIGVQQNNGSVEDEIIIKNHTIVHASFRIERVDTDMDCTFAFSPVTGVVEANSEFKVKVRYTPVTHSCYSSDRFKIITPGI